MKSPNDPAVVNRDVTAKIAHRVASAEGTSVENLRPLYEVIDSEALDGLFRQTVGTLTFEYLGYEIQVDHEQRVDVTPK